MRFFACVLALDLALGFVPTSSADGSGQTYYLDSAAGDDVHDGASPEAAWRTLGRANQASFAPGDCILFRAGREWEGAFLPRGSGRDGASIVVDRYGDGAKPAIHGRGQVPVVLQLNNQSHWEIQNLTITNFSEAGEADRRGVEVRTRDQGWVKHIYLRDLDIRNVNAVSDYRNDGDTVAKSFGGLATIIEGDQTPTAWDDLRIENCTVSDVGPIGIVMLSTWMKGHREENPATWFPSRRVVIRGNTIERTARNGLIVRGCVGPLIERNLFNGCAQGGSGNACFAFHCDDAIFQYNESCFTKYNEGDTDATGFDSDYNCRRSVFQFNYSHDNEYGFMVVCCQPPKGFNDGTIVRYNVSQNDGGNVFRFSGAITNTSIYNNTIYIDPKMTNPKLNHPPRIIYHKSWNKGWSNGLTFANNIIVNHSPPAVYDHGSSKNNRYRANLFFGLHPQSEPAEQPKFTADPLLTNPGGATRGIPSAISAYALLEGSPAVAAGRVLPNHPARDFAGRRLSTVEDRVDLGALAAEKE